MKKLCLCGFLVAFLTAAAGAANYYGHPYWDGPPPLGGVSYYSSMDAQITPMGDSLYVLYGERGSDGNFIAVWGRVGPPDEWVFDHKILAGQLAFPHAGNIRGSIGGVVADSDNNRVLIIGPNGEVKWEYALEYPNDGEFSSDVRKILTSEWSRGLKEIDIETGLVTWEYQSPGENFHDADYIPGGVQYVNSHTGEVGEVVQIDRAGVIIWSHHPVMLTGWIRNAERLNNGGVLVADNRMIVAITRSHKEKVFYDLGGDCGLYNIHVTAEGLLYATGSGRVGMITPDGQSISWEVMLPREEEPPVLDFETWRSLRSQGYI